MHRNTRTSTSNRLRIAVAVLALAAVAAAAPAGAQAMVRSDDLVTRQPRVQYSSGVSSSWLRLGPKYVTIHRPAGPASPTTPSTRSPRGFDWRVTAVGLGGVVFALALVATVVMLGRRRRGAPQPERSSLSGA